MGRGGAGRRPARGGESRLRPVEHRRAGDSVLRAPDHGGTGARAGARGRTARAGDRPAAVRAGRADATRRPAGVRAVVPDPRPRHGAGRTRRRGRRSPRAGAGHRPVLRAARSVRDLEGGVLRRPPAEHVLRQGRRLRGLPGSRRGVRVRLVPRVRDLRGGAAAGGLRGRPVRRVGTPAETALPLVRLRRVRHRDRRRRSPPAPVLAADPARRGGAHRAGCVRAGRTLHARPGDARRRGRAPRRPGGGGNPAQRRGDAGATGYGGRVRREDVGGRGMAARAPRRGRHHRHHHDRGHVLHVGVARHRHAGSHRSGNRPQPASIPGTHGHVAGAEVQRGERPAPSSGRHPVLHRHPAQLLRRARRSTCTRTSIAPITRCTTAPSRRCGRS